LSHLPSPRDGSTISLTLLIGAANLPLILEDGMPIQTTIKHFASDVRLEKKKLD